MEGDTRNVRADSGLQPIETRERFPTGRIGIFAPRREEKVAGKLNFTFSFVTARVNASTATDRVVFDG